LCGIKLEGHVYGGVVTITNFSRIQFMLENITNVIPNSFNFDKLLKFIVDYSNTETFFKHITNKNVIDYIIEFCEGDLVPNTDEDDLPLTPLFIIENLEDIKQISNLIKQAKNNATEQFSGILEKINSNKITLNLG
jgi:hypothetical protein